MKFPHKLFFSLAKRGRLIIIGLITSYESDGKGLQSTSSLADLKSIPSLVSASTDVHVSCSHIPVKAAMQNIVPCE